MNNIISDSLNTIFKSILAFSVLFILTRLMGKKQISQLTFFDYVVGICIGSIAANTALSSGSEFYKGFIAMIVFACFAILLSYITLKSFTARSLLDGTPTIIIQNGKIIEKNLKKSKFNINDLLEQLRIGNAFNIKDVEFAILETNGELSIQLKPYKQPLTTNDMNISTKYQGICINLIIDGKIISSNLNTINKDNNWLINELKKQNINSPSEVLLASLDSNNNLHIDKKNSDPPLLNV
jgi:uncharacterized membrane protein YcaP (DUF421 family)